MNRFRAVVCLLFPMALAAAGCSSAPELPPARAILLISIDTLRADHLGTYGYARDTSPFLDELASRGAVFENAFAQFPATLPSHMSIFTGLYPSEHGVFPPRKTLSPDIATLPEVLQRHGFATAGHTEDGYVYGGYGFSRGFDEWSDEAGKIYSDVERTLERGLDFVRRQSPGKPFFLFLHTYAVHDPYFPPEPYASRYWPGEKPATFAPTGPNLIAYNHGRLGMPEGAGEYYKALYDGSIRYLDAVLARFFEALDREGWGERLTVVLTSDHGEEFLEHGGLGHGRLYPEHLRVPLIVVSPGVEPQRIGAMVETIDIAPTVLELAGLPPLRPASGRSLVPLLAGTRDTAGWSTAFAQAEAPSHRTLFRLHQGNVYQYLERRQADGRRARWILEGAVFDVTETPLRLTVRSYRQPRRLRVSVDGKLLTEVPILPDRWQDVRLDLPGPRWKWRVQLEADGCAIPAELGESRDERCLSFAIRGPSLEVLELFDLDADPLAQRDLSASRESLVQSWREEAAGYVREPVAPPGTEPLDAALRAHLEALGYLD